MYQSLISYLILDRRGVWHEQERERDLPFSASHLSPFHTSPLYLLLFGPLMSHST
jgi:hypothetical protein